MSLSLENLQEFLLQEEEQQANSSRENPDEPPVNSENACLHHAVQDVLHKHGILPPLKGLWLRPLPPNVYRCPPSAPQTTLVTWSSLPHAVRGRLSSEEHDDNEVMEVPLTFLTADDMEDASNLHRPISGNLTDKLSEYTRGVVGRCRPFRAGGFGAEDTPVSAEPTEEFRTPQEIQMAQEVLEKGTEASWKNGTILTAPPRVDFKVGLSWKDVYGEEREEPVVEQASAEKEPEPMESSFIDGYNEPLLATSDTMWDRAIFDDDSLFGESSESEDEDEDESEASEDTGPDHNVENLEKEKDPLVNEDNTGGEDAVDDVDKLLAELAASEADPFEKQQSKKAISNNPLELAERHARDEQNTTRKTWANTHLLPIDDFASWVPNPAVVFPFTLDDFQQQAVARLERSESIFVAAHTSAGKTVVAEYACALAKQRGTRCIYTSPIKALSNQKFRDFCQKFGSENVGLITGDLQLNADDSTCLIMTTEILRSMLYRGADLIRDIEFVIFDECHYVNDSERGVVWEEVIIMLPQYVNLIFLSATTPNTVEFSDWIGRTKRKLVHVIRTNYRPVPLSHFLWAGLKLHKVKEGGGGFSEKGYAAAANALLPASAKNDNNKKGAKGKTSAPPTSGKSGSKHLAWQAQGSKQNWMSLVRFLDRELLTPAVVFSFSKKKCEEIANMLRSLDLNTAAERSAVQGFTLQTIARLSPIDATLPQVLTVCEMVKRGIGVHHGGLLPILKEMVEILFSRNFIKVLFATETFAMGVNMPARAVVFNSIRKHDGTKFRVLEPGEYTQMAGRAGRRGLDKVGTVILCCFGEEPPPMPILRNLLTGSSTKLRSQFRLTYNMILNLLRVEDMSVEGMIKRSFSEFATQRELTANQYPKLLARGTKSLEKLDKEFEEDAIQRVGAEDLEEYFRLCADIRSLNRLLLSEVFDSTDAKSELPFQVGRIFLVTAARRVGVVRAPGLLLRAPQKSDSSKISVVLMTLLPESYVASDLQDKKSQDKPKPGTLNYIGFAKQRYYIISEFSLDEVTVVSQQKRKIDTKVLFKGDAPSSLGTPASQAGGFPPSSFDNPFAGLKARGKKSKDDDDLRKKGPGSVKEEQLVEQAVEFLTAAEQEELGSGLPLLNLRECVKSGNDVMAFRQQCDKLELLVGSMRSFSSHHHSNLEKFYLAVEKKETLRSQLANLRHILSNESLRLFPDFLQRKSVLRTLGYIDENDTVCVKGRVACEVNTCEELIVTEMVFEGLLNDLDPSAIVAALSALVFQDKSGGDDFDTELPESLRNCCEGMKKIATNLGKLQNEHGLDIDPGEYCDASLKFGLVHVVYEWALGVPFSSICELTLVQEGSIVRCITRLDELCREVRNCARVVGNPTLYRKMEAASVAIKRDIVFAASLYVS